MKRLAILGFGLALMLFAAIPALAFARSVTLSVPGMYCPSCPVTVRVVLERVQRRGDLFAAALDGRNRIPKVG